MQSYALKSDGHLFGQPQGPSKIEVTFSPNDSVVDVDAYRGRHGAQGDSRTRGKGISNILPEQASSPLPPVAGCKPASTSAFPESTRHVSP
jgi:hypothetical protein